MDRWQIISKSADIVEILKETQWYLSTVDLGIPHPGGQYESCLFTDEDSNVLERYETQEAAIEGHRKYAKLFGLTLFSG